MAQKKCAHEHTGPAESIRPSLRNGLTAYGALSLETNSSCLHRRRIDGFANPVGLRENLRRFDTSHGCQDHTLLPYAASFTKPSDRPWATGRSSGGGVLAPFVYTLSIAHGKPPCEHALRAQRRRVHRIPSQRFRDDRDTPLVQGMRCASYGGFGEAWEAEYFGEGGWSTNYPSARRLMRDCSRTRHFRPSGLRWLSSTLAQAS